MLIGEIAHYVAAQRNMELPEAVEWHARRALLDWLAALYPGTQLDPNPKLRAVFQDIASNGPCRVLGSEMMTDVRHAALLNGASSHTSEFDDIYKEGTMHPGSATIAAALAVADMVDADMQMLLRAITAGYEVCTRLSEAMGRTHYAFWHSTATMSSFGAAAAAALLLGLDKDQTAHALATVGTMAAGLQQAFRADAMSKPLHAGHAADVGVLAALSARQGVTGALDILEGPAGMGVAMSRDVDWSIATKGLGQDFNIEKITFKNHGCCGHTFAAIDAALIVKAEHKISIEDIIKVEVGTYAPALAITDKLSPTTVYEAKFSLQYTLAHALLYGAVRLDAFTPERLADERIHELASKVVLNIDPEIDQQFPHKRAARVTLTMKDGQQYTQFQPHRKGDPEWPLTDQDLSDKFHELSRTVLCSSQQKDLENQIWSSNNLPVRSLNL